MEKKYKFKKINKEFEKYNYQILNGQASCMLKVLGFTTSKKKKFIKFESQTYLQTLKKCLIYLKNLRPLKIIFLIYI